MGVIKTGLVEPKLEPVPPCWDPTWERSSNLGTSAGISSSGKMTSALALHRQRQKKTD